MSRNGQSTTLDDSAAYSMRWNLKEVCPNAHQALDVLTRQVHVESVQLHFFMPFYENSAETLAHIPSK